MFHHPLRPGANACVLSGPCWWNWCTAWGDGTWNNNACLQGISLVNCCGNTVYSAPIHCHSLLLTRSLSFPHSLYSAHASATHEALHCCTACCCLSPRPVIVKNSSFSSGASYLGGHCASQGEKSTFILAEKPILDIP